MKQKALHLGLDDFMLANRRAARLEEFERHGKAVTFRTATHNSKKAYNRSRSKREAQELYAFI